MAITEIDMPFQQVIMVGADWRSLRSDQDIQWRAEGKRAIVIDMTIEQRNKLDSLETWQYINIPTPDFSTPSMTAQQWLNLAAFVYNEGDHENKGCRVYIACQGGQGRTGIALAILYSVLTEDFTNPVKAIRKFNPHFIETPAQEAYVTRIVKEIDELTKPAPASVAPVDWPVRAGKAERRVAELEAKIAELVIENSTLRDQATYLKDSVSIVGKELNDALKSIAGVWELVNPFMDNESLEIGDLYDA